MTLRALFVDEKPSVLEGYRKMFLPMKSDWDTSFASGGPEALSAMIENPVDVVVVDLRKDSQEGEELLKQARDFFPQTVRIVVMGQASRDVMLKFVPLAHRFLNKPCEPKALKAAVKRVRALRDLLQGDKLKALIGRLGSLPTPAGQSAQFLAELDSPDRSLVEVGKMIGRDVGLSAKLMQLANSALFGLRHPATGPGAAVQALGVETTKAVILMSAAVERFEISATGSSFSIAQLWEHSRMVGTLAGRIAKLEGEMDAVAVAQVGGILHDVGRLALACMQKDSYREVLKASAGNKMPVCEAERMVFGATHAEVGAYLLGLWGLQDTFVEVVAWHHTPSGLPTETFTPLTAVHAAEAILGMEEGSEIDSEYLAKLGLKDRLQTWAELLGKK